MGRCKSAALVGALLGLSVAATLTLSSVMESTRPRQQRHGGEEDGGGGGGGGLLDLRHFRHLVDVDDAEPCRQATLALLVVTSHAGHVEARSAMRRAYPSAELAAMSIRRVFLLAVPRQGDPDYVSQAALQDEASRFQDLVQGDFFEAYRNLSYKHVMGLRWAAERCPGVSLVLKMDDDVVVDLPRLLRLLGAKHRVDDAPTITGYVLQGRSPVREPRSKWFVTREEYPGDGYPPFLSGWMYATTPRVAGELARVAQRLPYFWIDDVFVTGLAAREAGVRHRDVKDVFASHVELLRCCLASNRYQCDFMVGPNGGQTNLIVEFEKHAARCRKVHCRTRPAHKSLRKTCVVKRTAAQPSQRGHALVEPLPLR